MAVNIDYLLHLADNALVLSQRNSEWCGHGPALEEDMAMANQSLDLIGQARLLYQHVSALRKDGCTSEDLLAYFRDPHEFRNYTLLELPHGVALLPTARGDRDYAVTIVRNFFYSALMVLVWQALKVSSDGHLSAIAAKSLKEAEYHLRHARDWLIRLGEGTELSHQKTQAALDYLMPYTQEFWIDSPMEILAAESGQGVLVSTLKERWEQVVLDAVDQATLAPPSSAGFVTAGKQGTHSEHLGFLLAEMQSLARAHPTAVW